MEAKHLENLIEIFGGIEDTDLISVNNGSYTRILGGNTTLELKKSLANKNTDIQKFNTLEEQVEFLVNKYKLKKDYEMALRELYDTLYENSIFEPDDDILNLIIKKLQDINFKLDKKIIEYPKISGKKVKKEKELFHTMTLIELYYINIIKVLYEIKILYETNYVRSR